MMAIVGDSVVAIVGKDNGFFGKMGKMGCEF